MIQSLLPILLNIALSLAAALAIFLFLLNRVLILRKDSDDKLRLIIGTFILFMLGALAFALLASDTLWMLVPILVLVGILVGEIRRLILRRWHRGAPPLFAQNAGISLAQPLTTTDLQIPHYEVALPGPAFKPFTVVHISDLHITSALPAEYYHQVIERVNALEPDFIFATGDFVTKSEFIPHITDVLAQAQSRLGNFASLGNHDYWSDTAAIAGAVRAGGFTLLENNFQRIQVGDNRDLLVSGCDAPWNSASCEHPVVASGEIILVLSHTADNIYTLSKAGAHAVFSGHYHGGQIRLPLLGSVVSPSKYGRRFDQGHFIIDGTHLFVSAGVGAAMPAFRIYCQPDILTISFTGTA